MMMEKIEKLLREHGAVVDVSDDEMAELLKECGSQVVDELFVAQIDSKGKESIPGFRQVGYDPGVYCCPWSKFRREFTTRIGSYGLDGCWHQVFIQVRGLKICFRRDITYLQDI